MYMYGILGKYLLLLHRLNQFLVSEFAREKVGKACRIYIYAYMCVCVCLYLHPPHCYLTTYAGMFEIQSLSDSTKCSDKLITVLTTVLTKNKLWVWFVQLKRKCSSMAIVRWLKPVKEWKDKIILLDENDASFSFQLVWFSQDLLSHIAGILVYSRKQESSEFLWNNGYSNISSLAKVLICLYTHANIHMHTHAYTHTYTHVHTYGYVYTYTHWCTCT